MRNKPTLLLTGASGQLGLTLQSMWPQHSLQKHFELCPMSRAELNIIHEAKLSKTIKKLRPDLIINAAAYNEVDRAEENLSYLRLGDVGRDDDVELVMANDFGVYNLACAAQANAARLIHISTDYVFSGESKQPYTPADRTGPISIYAHTKRNGEVLMHKLAQDTAQEVTKKRSRQRAPQAIVRTSWLYSTHRRNFLTTMLHLLAKQSELQVVNDQTGSPTSCRSLVKCLLCLAERMMLVEKTYPSVPTFHWCDSGAVTRYDFALAIRDEAMAADLLKRSTPIKPVSTADYQAQHPKSAPRPAYSVLDTSSTESELDIRPSPWREELRHTLKHMAKQP